MQAVQRLINFCVTLTYLRVNAILFLRFLCFWSKSCSDFLDSKKTYNVSDAIYWFRWERCKNNSKHGRGKRKYNLAKQKFLLDVLLFAMNDGDLLVGLLIFSKLLLLLLLKRRPLRVQQLLLLPWRPLASLLEPVGRSDRHWRQQR